jgi:hypothetical protein
MTERTETPRRLFRRAARGRDAATPAIVISGVTVIIAVLVVVISAIALLVYFLV